MVSTTKLKSVDFYRKIPRDLTEASLSGAGLSIAAAFFMIFLFGMELKTYMTVSTSTTVVVDNSADGEFLRIDFNLSFPALSCEFASVDVSDVLGTNRLNLTKTVRKYPIDSNLRPTGSEFMSGQHLLSIKHDEDNDEEYSDGSATLNADNFVKASHEFHVLVVNFHAPWCPWSALLKPSWEKAAKNIMERYDPNMDGRILVGNVDCTTENDLCRRNHIQGYPSIRIFRKGSDVREDHGHHEHETYYGDRDLDSLIKFMENLVASVSKESKPLALDGKVAEVKKPAPSAGGCRVEGFVRVKKVPGNLVVSARSASHSFDASQMNMSHVISHFSFGRSLSPREIKDVRRLLPWIYKSRDKLDGQAYISNPSESNANVTIEHYIQAVKTEVMTRSYKLLEQYEYTAHSSLIHSLHVPVAKFHFELSPMQVLITEDSKSFSHFITNVCAIIGGVFTVAGILDSILHNTMTLMKKVELGKHI